MVRAYACADHAERLPRYDQSHFGAIYTYAPVLMYAVDAHSTTISSVNMSSCQKSVAVD